MGFRGLGSIGLRKPSFFSGEGRRRLAALLALFELQARGGSDLRDAKRPGQPAPGAPRLLKQKT